MKTLILLILLSNTTTIFATNNNYSINIDFLKQHYVGHEPIHITLTIANPNMEEKTFYVTETLYQSIKFDLRTSRNEIIPLKNSISSQLRTKLLDPTSYRMITLLQGEAFSQTFDLRDFYDIGNEGMYYIEASFFPDPDNRNVFSTSEFNIFVQSPPKNIQRQIIIEEQQKQAKQNKLSSLPPNEVVKSFFENQYKKDWDFFLQHIDPALLIYSFPNYSHQYDKAINGNIRLDILDQFQRFLTVHWNIPLTSYTIQETVIQDETATVTVTAIESIHTTSRRLRYSFILYKTGSGSWLINEYFVLPLN